MRFGMKMDKIEDNLVLLSRIRKYIIAMILLVGCYLFFQEFYKILGKDILSPIIGIIGIILPISLVILILTSFVYVVFKFWREKY